MTKREHCWHPYDAYPGTKAERCCHCGKRRRIDQRTTRDGHGRFLQDPVVVQIVEDVGECVEDTK